MATEYARDQATDHFLTPRNAALVVIDHQPSLKAVLSDSPGIVNDRSST